MPTRLKLLHGETRPSRLNRREPVPRDGRPRMPLDMSPAAKTVWRHVLREMAGTGVITAVDRDVLRLYCEAVARYVHAATMLEQSGPLIVAGGAGARRGELVKSPLHQIVRDEGMVIRAMARELGLTPAARAGLSGRAVSEEVDPFEAFLRSDEA